MNNRLIHENEKTFYPLCFVMSIITYIMLIISLIGIVYIIVGILITFFLHGIAIGNIKNNGVKVSERQFPEIYTKTREMALNMGIKDLPDVYIIQSDGLLNAFATRFIGRNFIVLYSEITDIIDDGYNNELNFIIAHELAHIKRNHIIKNLLILPALWIPFLGNAYSRACEFTCDRIASAYTDNAEAASNALSILAVGKVLFSKLNTVDYIMNHESESGFFVWLTKVLSTHPPLPKRLKELERIKAIPEIYSIKSVS